MRKCLGENVEPSELEEAAMRSKLIQQIVVIGQVLPLNFVLFAVLTEFNFQIVYFMVHQI